MNMINAEIKDYTGGYDIADNKFKLNGNEIEIKERFDYKRDKKTRYYLYNNTKGSYASGIFDYKIGSERCLSIDYEGGFYLFAIDENGVYLSLLANKKKNKY